MRRYTILVATLFVIGMNAAANILPINGVTTGELSASYPTGFTPAGWVFSIWSLIYLGLLALSIWAIRARGEAAQRIRNIETPYLISSAANASWILLWHYERILESLAVMLVLLASLVTIYARLRRQPPVSRIEWWCVAFPISLYLGWITTATLANFGAWFFDAQFYPFGLAMDEWALVTVVLAVSIYVAAGTRLRDPIYTAVFVWASLGIVYQTLPISEPVRLAAAAGFAVVAILTMVLIARNLLAGRVPLRRPAIAAQ
jgi:translocator protein